MFCLSAPRIKTILYLIRYAYYSIFSEAPQLNFSFLPVMQTQCKYIPLLPVVRMDQGSDNLFPMGKPLEIQGSVSDLYGPVHRERRCARRAYPAHTGCIDILSELFQKERFRIIWMTAQQKKQLPQKGSLHHR